MGEGNNLVSTSDGAYWSSSFNTVNFYPQRAWYLHLLDIGVSSSHNGRYYGCSVRPVKEKPLPEGALRGLFSVSATEQVHFSKGNLYCSDKGSGSSPRYEFKFESKQYDFRLRNSAGNYSMKDGNSYTVPANESGMFQWNKGNAVNGSDYGAFSSGSPTGDPSDHVDWGEAISNDGTWFTLNKDQWTYLVERKSSTGKPLVSWAVVGGIKGLLLAPDYYSGFDSDYFEWTLSQWLSYESDGFVFLPACGFLSMSTGGEHQSPNDSFYMTFDAEDSQDTLILCASYSIDSEFQPGVWNAGRSAAHPVRLVTVAE